MTQMPHLDGGDGAMLGYGVTRARPATGLATAAAVCGVVGMATCVFPVGLAGVVLGIVALVRTKRDSRRYGGAKRALAGIVSGLLSLLLALAAVELVRPGPGSSAGSGRILSTAHLRGIGQGCHIYANDWYGQMPPDLHVLVDELCVTYKQLLDPMSGNRAPTCDYFYVTGLTRADPADWIVAYGNPGYHGDEGAAILLMDGHAEFVEEPEFGRLIDAFKDEYEKVRGAPPVIIPPG